MKNSHSIALYSTHSNVYGLARTLLAIGTLMTLVCNDVESIFVLDTFKTINNPDFFETVNLFYLFGHHYALEAKILAIIILLLVIIGLHPRFTGIFHWWVSFSLFNAATITDGGDQITSNLTLLLIPITLLDNRKSHWNTGYPTLHIASIFSYSFFLLIKIQMAFLYLHAATEKMYKVDEWIDGSAVYYWFNNNAYGASGWIQETLNLIITRPLVSFISWGTILLELILFAALFMDRKSKLVMFFLAIFFHFMIIVVHGLFSFFFGMLGGLVLYLIPLNFDVKYVFRKFKFIIASWFKKLNLESRITHKSTHIPVPLKLLVLHKDHKYGKRNEIRKVEE